MVCVLWGKTNEWRGGTPFFIKNRFRPKFGKALTHASHWWQIVRPFIFDWLDSFLDTKHSAYRL